MAQHSPCTARMFLNGILKQTPMLDNSISIPRLVPKPAAAVVYIASGECRAWQADQCHCSCVLSWPQSCHRPGRTSVIRAVVLALCLILLAGTLHQDRWLSGRPGGAAPRLSLEGAHVNGTAPAQEPEHSGDVASNHFSAWRRYARRNRCELHR